MPEFALNHMTVAGQSYEDFLDIASAVNCTAIEVRNDLEVGLFCGFAPEQAGALATQKGLLLKAVAEVKNFNNWNAQTAADAASLINTAKLCGASAISLIPRNDGERTGEQERQADLRAALAALKPMLEASDITGLIEPLGFSSSSLRYKAEVVNAIKAVNGSRSFALIHDTFHHALAGESAVFPEVTAIVHLSGVVNATLQRDEMVDSDRVLVDETDVLGNVGQLSELLAGGFTGLMSFEVFAPEVHSLEDPVTAIKNSINYIRSQLPALAL